ncbi:MAG: hypothetical protein IKE92_07740 [Clostridiales bacterium]|nr:hypothetical protein [Clostridiales bacterium]
MFIVLLNMILSSIVLIVLLCLALFLTAAAIALIIISLVRSSKAKKQNRKTRKVGLWVGIAMLVIPWVMFGFAVCFVKITDIATNRWKFDRAVVAQAVVDKDADTLYGMMATDILDDNNLTTDDLEDFLDQCDIENDSPEDMKKYTSFESLGEPLDPEGNHYRPDGNRFSYEMFYVNDDGDRIYMEGILYDAKDSGNVGIHYIEFLTRDPETRKYSTAAEFGEKSHH